MESLDLSYNFLIGHLIYLIMQIGSDQSGLITLLPWSFFLISLASLVKFILIYSLNYCLELFCFSLVVIFFVI